jgi:hypothetical protein
MCVSHAARDFFTQRRRLTDPRQAHRRELAQELLLRGVPRRAKLGERTPRRQKQGKPLEATQPRAATAAAEASSSGTTRPSLGFGHDDGRSIPGIDTCQADRCKGLAYLQVQLPLRWVSLASRARRLSLSLASGAGPCGTHTTRICVSSVPTLSRHAPNAGNPPLRTLLA